MRKLNSESMGITANFNGTIQCKHIKIKMDRILADWLSSATQKQEICKLRFFYCTTFL